MDVKMSNTLSWLWSTTFLAFKLKQSNVWSESWQTIRKIVDFYVLWCYLFLRDIKDTVVNPDTTIFVM